MLDKIKLIIATGLVAGGIFGFYYYETETAFLYRLLGMLTAFIVSLVIAKQTVVGTTSWDFGRSAYVEIRKVVWPTRQETFQTTLIVIIMVTIIGIMLWLFDRILLIGVQALTGQGG
ncbi:MAG: preprotein translocase subunit SecE [Thiohalomonadales bacterium]